MTRSHILFAAVALIASACAPRPGDEPAAPVEQTAVEPAAETAPAAPAEEPAAAPDASAPAPAETAAAPATPTALAAIPPAPATPAAPAPAQVSAETLALGRSVYAQSCAMCHGPTGAGMGVAGGPPKVTGLTDDAAVTKKIVDGGTGMPPMGGMLSADQIKAVTSYITAGMPAQ